MSSPRMGSDPVLALLRERAVLTAFDEHFAVTVGRIAGEERDEVLLAAALVANHVGHGHVCLDLFSLAGESPYDPETGGKVEDVSFPELSAWTEALHGSPLVSVNGEPRPLVLEGSRLYFRRYFDYERDLADRLREKAERVRGDVDEEHLREGLDRLFPGDDRLDKEQRAAAETVLRYSLSVVTGGPGTGKTWTVVRILALLVEQALARNGVLPRVHLLAPTGKAAGRLREVIERERNTLPLEEAVRAALPEETMTIHRVLGVRPGGRFRHDDENPLVTDAVIVDEASMVDLALMTRLVRAVPVNARLVLLGDPGQLASVEAGSVLADVCGRGADATASGTTPVAIAGLTGSRRFRERPAIGELASAIRRGEAKETLEVLRGGSRDEVEFLEHPSEEQLAGRIRRGYREFLDSDDATEQLHAFGAFRILCAHRRGPTSVQQLNSLVERTLAGEGRIEPTRPFYVGRPLLVTRNDPATELSNGDVGIIVDTGDGTKAVFLRETGGQADAPVRLLSTARLPAVETAFAMTVHKSQGSEFDHVVVVLPDEPSVVVTRELLYTAVTRAKEKVTIVGPEETVRHALATPTSRSSGLADRLWKKG